MELKPCQIQDLDKLQAITHKSYKQHYAYLWSDQGDSYVKNHLSRSLLELDITQHRSEVYFITTEQKLAGVVKLNYSKGIQELSGHESMEIQRIYLLDEFTGQGLGTETLQKVELLAREKGFRVLWLKAMLSGPALSFYKKNGFNITGESSLEIPNIKPHLKEMRILVKQLKDLP